ncbi:mandelate racemase/muconate lactonizing enzyme family protein [Ancylobacter sp. MQZ15Z-1]|uniref:Mandelate racemase/muconate lactonizing enzyme family protein n=1 Tax=Ancylobacter mangrovi TaxID=2972472 RepID=A0A9X2P9C9_9HYPH|nr:mandelate racemase/muconate lactonizing enzyme family protein [Ancylobacter mangrovi]MCS0494441.1 mandelate racemase/muconate lactonizing enzyme family protein [Ancylobacter mangrovi]
MKIAELRTHVLEAPLEQPFGWSVDRTTVRKSCIVEIVTDTGLVGWGECFGPARPNAAVVNVFRDLLIGADPIATDVIWQNLYNRFRDQGQKGLVISGLSGVDIALWDIKGKAFGVPVHRLMGGPMRTRIQAYATGTYRRDEGDVFEYILEEVRERLDEGFEGVKLKIGIDFEEDIELIRATRDLIGPGRQLMLDANHAYDAIEAIQLGRRVADQNIAWFEEPVVPEDLASYHEVKLGQPIPVAGGECDYTRWGFINIFTSRAMDIVQPDTGAAGGLSECKKIADMATAFGIRYIPHVWGSGISMAAALQLLASVPHTPARLRPREPLLEMDRSEHPFRHAVITEPLVQHGGWVEVPTGPGLGIEVDRDALRRFAAPDP